MSGRLTAAASAGRVNRWIAQFALLILVVLAAIPPTSLAHGNSQSFKHGKSHKSELKIFGDSLSDTGNAAALGAPLTFRPFDGLIPDGPYFTLRFSNGRTWIERLARRLGTRDSARAALIFSGTGGNYAVGGGRARDIPETFDLPEQVAFYLYEEKGKSKNKLKRNDRAVVQFGGNDIRDAITAYGAGGEAAAGLILCEAVASIEDNIELLYYKAHARNVVLVTAPDLGLTPAITSLVPVIPNITVLATNLSEQFNFLLILGDMTGGCAALGVDGVDGVLSLKGSLSHIDIIVFDIFSLLQEVVGDPGAFGLSNATDSCITPGVIVGAVCENPWKFVFWDGIHPTAAMHRIVGQRAFYRLLFASWGS
jgi:phospholipase/lecithinase/hemolysin